MSQERPQSHHTSQLRSEVPRLPSDGGGGSSNQTRGDGKDSNFMEFLFKNGAEGPSVVPDDGRRASSTVKESVSGTSLSSLPTSFGPNHGYKNHINDPGQEIETGRQGRSLHCC